MSAATLALAGNPNSGKTTLFNSLTGGHQYVGNYPGVTVEKKEGYCIYKGRKFKIVDILSIYKCVLNIIIYRNNSYKLPNLQNNMLLQFYKLNF